MIIHQLITVVFLHRDHHGAKSPSTSGHHSAGSKLSVSSPSASPSSIGKLSPSPPQAGSDNYNQMVSSTSQYQSSSITTSRGGAKSEEAITKLRKEITSLRERFANRQKDWAEVGWVWKRKENIYNRWWCVYYLNDCQVLSSSNAKNTEVFKYFI